MGRLIGEDLLQDLLIAFLSIRAYREMADGSGVSSMGYFLNRAEYDDSGIWCLFGGAYQLFTGATEPLACLVNAFSQSLTGK